MAVKTVLVTGASGGIGSEIARTFASHGYQVMAAYHRHAEAANRLVAEIHAAKGKAASFRADLTDETQVDRLFAATEAQMDPVNVLVNCVGLAHTGLFQDMTLHAWNHVLQANITPVFLCCKRALRPMLREKEGAIINIGSIWGEAGASCEAAYSAAKAAVSGLTKALAKEAGPSGIRVNAIAPGWIETKMNANLSEEDRRSFCEDIALGRTGAPQEVAEAALFLAENNYITGQILRLDGGYCI